jgi:SAM-dependent methyltransferase
MDPAGKRAFFDELAPRWESVKPADASARGAVRGLSLLGPLEGRTVVDLGCGTGLLEGHLLPLVGDGRIVAIDFSERMLELARARHGSDRVTWLCRDVLETGLPAGSADAVLCFDAFPHFPDPAGTMGEVARWLREAGTFLLWHDIGREELARVHGDGPPPIRQDLLIPVESLAEIVADAGLVVDRAEEDEGSYTLLAHRAAERR